MLAGGSRTIPVHFDSLLTQGYRMLAQGGDIDIEEIPPMHRTDWRPAPSEDEPWRAELVDQRNAEYRRRSCNC